MIVNLAYSKLLSDSAVGSEFYQRRLSQEPDAAVIRVDIRKLLVPPTEDRGYMNFCAEQLVQLCRSSIFAKDLLRIDPRNTYQYPFTAVPEKQTRIGALPTGFEITILEPSVFHTWINSSVRIAVDVSMSRAQLNDSWYVFTLPSAPLDLGNATSVAFKGVMPASDFLVDITMQRRPERNVKGLAETLRGFTDRMLWHAPYVEYKFAKEDDLFIAAFVMNFLEYDGN